MCSPAFQDPGSRAPSTSELPLELVEREICELASHIASATCRWLLLVAEFDARGGWAEWGVKSCAHWLSWRCGIALRSAREHVRVARALTVLPLVREAFLAGELSYSKVRALTRVADSKTEADLVELALHATGGQLDRLVRAYGGVLRATLEHAEQIYAARSLHHEWGEDGMLHLRARLAPDEGALVLAALNAAEKSVPEDEFAVRQADALVALARTGLAADEGAVRAGGDRCEVIVHVDAASLVSEQTGERSELESGPALPPETVRRLGCDASLVRIVERDGRPLSVGRRRRTVPPALRRALRSRDRGCRFPGCTHSRFLHAHHIHHWARGGPTELNNLVQLCSHHHRLVHEGGFQVERAGAGTVRFRRPDGALIPEAPARARGDCAALIDRNRSAGVAVDARTCMPRSAGDRLDYGIAVEGLLAQRLAGT